MSIIVQDKEQLERIYELYKHWLGIRYVINKKGKARITMTPWHFVADCFKFVFHFFGKHSPK
jgi:hypothetical protein